MMHNLREKYKKMKQKRLLKKYKNNLNLSVDSIYSSLFHFDLRHPEQNKEYLKIGHMCNIDANFVFETETGHITIGNNCVIGNCTFISKTEINIGNDVTIASGSTFYDHDSHSIYWNYRKNDNITEVTDIKKYGDSILNKDWEHVNTKPIIIEDKVWIGINCIILKGVTIGEGSVIGAGSVVTKDVPAWTVVAGNPARVCKKIEIPSKEIQ